MNEGPTEPAVVLASGGIDSAVALWWARDQGYDVRALTYHYHLRPEPEKEAARTLAREAGADPVIEVDLPHLREVDDVDPVPPDLRDAPKEYVPHRNLVFYSMAAHHAERVGAQVLVGGHNGVDPERFPDSGPAFLEGVEDLLEQGRAPGARGGIEIRNPLHGDTKEEVVERGLELGVPFESTWSCGEYVTEPCGECHSCRERREALRAVGVEA
jgi:7-cyano-7-deazaguanine synthase